MIYVWQLPKKKAVDYEGKLQLSQFDIMETAFRGLNYSRGNNSEFHTVFQKCIFCSKTQFAKNSSEVVNMNFCAKIKYFQRQTRSKTFEFSRVKFDNIGF